MKCRAALIAKLLQLASQAQAGNLLRTHPSLHVGHAAWLLVDSVSCGLLTPKQALPFFAMDNLQPSVSSSSSGNSAAVVAFSDDVSLSALTSAVRAIATLRSDSSVVDLDYRTLDAVLQTLIHRASQLSVDDARILLNHLPSINAERTSLCATLTRVLCNAWCGKLADKSIAFLVTMMQAIGSVLCTPAARHELEQVDWVALDASLELALARRNILRSITSSALTMYAKAMAVTSQPLSPMFARILDLFVTHCVEKLETMEPHELIRVLHAINRVCTLTKSSRFEKESARLLQRILAALEPVQQSAAGRRETHVAPLDSTTIIMLIRVLSFQFPDCIAPTSETRAPPAPPPVAVKGASQSSGCGEMGAPATRTPPNLALSFSALAQRLVSTISTISARGIVTLCRAIATANYSKPLHLQDDFCEALLERLECILCVEEANLSLNNKMEIMCGCNVVLGKTSTTRSRAQRILVALLEQHPFEGSATELSMFLSAFAATFGVPIGSGEIALTAADEPPCADRTRRRGHMAEADLGFLYDVISKASAAPLMTAYAYSTTLRSFCRLGLTYAEVSSFVGRIFAVTDVHEHGAVATAPHTLTSLSHEPRNARDGQRSPVAVVSPYVAQMTLCCLAALRCDNFDVIRFVLTRLLMWQPWSALPEGLHKATNTLAESCPPLRLWLTETVLPRGCATAEGSR